MTDAFECAIADLRADLLARIECARSDMAAAALIRVYQSTLRKFETEVAFENQLKGCTNVKFTQ